MILQELAALYDRLADDPSYGLSKPGYSQQKIGFEIVLRPDGTLHGIHDVRVTDGKKKTAKPFSVPGQAKPSGQGLNPCFLWDNSAYMLGYKAEDEKPERTRKAFDAFRQKHLDLAKEIPAPAFQAVVRFLSHWNPERDAVAHREILNDAAATGFGMFRIQGAADPVHASAEVKAWWDRNRVASAGESAGRCLVTGDTAPIATLHEPAIKGVAGAQSSGAKLVSYNCAAFTSYAKEQGANAPVSESAAFRYCNALNTMLAHPRHRLRLGDMAVVFWTEKPSGIEDAFTDIFDEKSGADDSQDKSRLSKLAAFWELVRTGTPSPEDWKKFGDDPGTRFHLLGLAPNAARLSIRFWQTGTLGDFAARLRQHTDAAAIVRQGPGDKPFFTDREHPPLWLLLNQTARDSDGVPPLLGGALLRAILTGGPYPASMAQLIINRIRADRQVNRLRAGFLKAYLIRNHSQKIAMSLDHDYISPAYILGRLFAVYEKTQHDAFEGKLNSTIADRYYSAASATPRAVFGTLARMNKHHLGKLHPGAAIRYKTLIGEIADKLTPGSAYPSHLNLESQALFTLGYYHQNKALWTSGKTVSESSAAA